MRNFLFWVMFTAGMTLTTIMVAKEFKKMTTTRVVVPADHRLILL